MSAPESNQRPPPAAAAADGAAWPARVESEDALDELLTRPSPALVEFMRTVRGPLVVLGAGGKMGPSLAVLARRAAVAAGQALEVIAASRFSDTRARVWLEERGVTPVSVDLLDPDALNRLPDATNLIYLVGLKFGTAQNPGLTWAVNTLVPDRVCRRYPEARIVALSTGNVYPLSLVARGGAEENDPLTPLGEYANAAVARERIFDFHARNAGPSVALLRLYYAVELRYGVLVDIARKVFEGESIDLSNGHVTCIWQGDANEMILRSLDLVRMPPRAFNLCRPEVFSVRAIAEKLGQLMGRPPQFTGRETDRAIIGNAARLCDALGPPAIPLERMLEWIADWVARGGRSLHRPTHFETRDGSY
jgi:nucleoside-diphosphate-sugar epimerase